MSVVSSFKSLSEFLEDSEQLGYENKMNLFASSDMYSPIEPKEFQYYYPCEASGYQRGKDGLGKGFDNEVSPIGVDSAAVYFDVNAVTSSSSSSSSSTSSILSPRRRSQTLPENEDLACFVSLDASERFSELHNCHMTSLLARVDIGLRNGMKPVLADGALGGTYFLRDRTNTITLVCKPGDEEPNAYNNPYRQGSSKEGRDAASDWSYKGGIVPGTGMYREVAAYVIDDGFSGVPSTQLGCIRHPSLFCKRIANDSVFSWETVQDSTRKVCSYQEYVRHECSAEDLGNSKFLVEDVHRLAILDIRICNLDRHEGNILVTRGTPFATKRASSVPASSPKHAVADVTRRIASMCLNISSPMQPHGAIAIAEPVDENAGRPYETKFEVKSSLYLTRSDYGAYDLHLNEVGQADPSSGFALSSSAPSRPPSLLTSYFSPVAGLPKPGSPNARSAAAQLRLVPIDHGFSFPHLLHVDNANLAWMSWSQAKAPLSKELQDSVAGLDSFADAARILSVLGANSLPDTYLMTFHVCTYMLQRGVAMGLTLFQIGSLLVMHGDNVDMDEVDNLSSYSEMSPLQVAIHNAVRSTLSVSLQCTPVSDIDLQQALALDGGSALWSRLQEEVDKALNVVSGIREGKI